MNTLEFNNGNLFAVTYEDGGIYLSTNDGSTWTRKNKGVEDVWVYDLIISEGFIFALTDGRGIYLSSDNGENWSPIGFENIYVMENGITSSGDNIFIGTEMDGVYMSSDRGNTWAAIQWFIG